MFEFSVKFGDLEDLEYVDILLVYLNDCEEEYILFNF